MTVDLSPETQRLVEERMKAHGFASADEAIRAAFLCWDQSADFGDFAPGELESMIAEAEEEFRREGGLTREEVIDPILADLERLQSKE